MARLVKPLFLSLLALAVRAAPAHAAGIAGAVDETPSRWFVELASPPTADGSPAATVKAEKDAFRRDAAANGVRFTERRAFDRLFNGLSVEVPRGQAGKLARLPGVKAIWPVETLRLPETFPTEPDLVTALSMTGADVVQSALGFTGKGIRVAVMDTGIDYDHKAFGGDGVARSNSPFWAGPGGTNPASRVVAGFDLVGDAFDSSSADPARTVPHPDPFPDDCAGHGTHVAGIIGASKGATPFQPAGVAPGVVYGAYRVFGCEGTTESDIMLAAMELALHDKMDVLNMSIGSAFQWPQYPTAAAASRLVQNGMVVVASIGNSGADGLWSLGAPGVGERVIGVASFDNVRVVLPTFTIPAPTAADPSAVRAIGYNAASGLAPGVVIPTSGTQPMARTGTTTSTADACTALPAGSLADKVALIRRGTCSFYVKAKNAENAGAIGVVLYNNVAGGLNPTVAGSPPVGIPVVAVTREDGAAIDAAIAAGGVSMTWTDQVGSFPNTNAGLASSFSSYGLSPDLALKPDLGAPGGAIWSTYPLELGGYTSLSGTSMASPHVAGAAALLLEARPRLKATAVKAILQNTAEPALWWGNPALGFLDNVGREGAGMIHIDRAILSKAGVEPAALALGESQAGPQTRTLTVTNTGAAPVTYTLSDVAGVGVANTFAPTFFLASATVTFSRPTVTVPPGGTAAVDVTIAAPATPEKGQYGGWIVLTPDDGGDDLRVPYAGFIGDYQSIQVLAPTANGFPWLAKVVGDSFVKQADGAVFTLAGGDLPFFLLHLDHQSRSLRARVLDAATGAPARPAADAFREEFLPRNQTAAGFFSFAWDGTAQPGNAGKKILAVPNGTYVMEFTILKALGDPANPAHVETWRSPSFKIARP